MMEFFFSFLLINFLLLKISCYIKLELEKSNQNTVTLLNSNFTIINLIKEKLMSPIITTINIGNPSQKINLYLLMNDHIFSFNNRSENFWKNKKPYFPLNSNTFQICPNSTFENYSEIQYITGKDIIEFDFYTFFNKKEKKIKTFQKDILFYINNKNNQYFNLIGCLGLGPYSNEINNNFLKIPSFLSQLKKNYLISNYQWFINLSKDKNEIIFGLAPH